MAKHASSRVVVLTTLAMISFAANSLLCRLALTQTSIDWATFAAIRLIAGALVLFVFGHVRSRHRPGTGNWISALALFAYVATFSYAYVGLPAASGALLLFGAVQVTMVGQGLRRGERLGDLQWFGVLIAVAGLLWFLWPGLAAPSLSAAIAMLASGIAWGVYSLHGRIEGGPTRATEGNFVRAVPMAIVLLILMSTTPGGLAWDDAGVGYAVASGAITSGMGYVIWYAILPSLKASTAGVVQLSVPVLAAAGGVVVLSEPFTMRMAVASAAVLGGIAMVIARPAKSIVN